MYSKLHNLQVELTVYHNDWKTLDFLRRFLVTVNGQLLELLR